MSTNEGFFEGKISGSKRRESERFAEIAEDSISYFHSLEIVDSFMMDLTHEDFAQIGTCLS